MCNVPDEIGSAHWALTAPKARQTKERSPQWR
jgi:hypothetical protein